MTAGRRLATAVMWAALSVSMLWAGYDNFTLRNSLAAERKEVAALAITLNHCILNPPPVALERNR
jgi:hypothetical protein